MKLKFVPEIKLNSIVLQKITILVSMSEFLDYICTILNSGSFALRLTTVLLSLCYNLFSL